MQAANFETKVPDSFAAIRELVSEWANDVTDHVGTTFDDCYSCKVEEVENESRSGFIPFTDGGFNGIAYATLAAAHGSGFIPNPVRGYIDADLKAAETEWDRQNPEHPVSWIYLDDSEEREEWRERWYEFENEWLHEGGTYFYKIRALFFDAANHRNESGQSEVFFMVGLNTDFEYGRDHVSWLPYYGSKAQQTEWAWERNVPAKDVTPELIERFTREAIEALAKL